MLYFVISTNVGGPSYYLTDNEALAINKANEWLEIAELEEQESFEIDVLRLKKTAPFTISQWDAIHGRWV